MMFDLSLWNLGLLEHLEKSSIHCRPVLRILRGTGSLSLGQDHLTLFVKVVKYENLIFLIHQDQYASLGEYITYAWVPKKPRSGDKSRTYEVVIPESSLRVPGKYLAAYMSETQPYHMMGISDVFEVTRNWAAQDIYLHSPHVNKRSNNDYYNIRINFSTWFE